MDTQFNVNAHIHEFPLRGFSLNNIYTALVQNISGSIDETILPAVSNPDLAESSLAPFLDGSLWRVFDSDLSAYKPTKVKIGNVTLTADPTADRLQQVQNKAGVWALLDDAYHVQDVITLQEGLVSVDWNKGFNFQVILSGNRQSAFYMQHSKPGMERTLLITNSGTKQTIGTFDPLIKWPASSAPTMPASTPGAAKSLLINLWNIAGVIYGEAITYEHMPITGAILAKAVPSQNFNPTGGVGQ